MIGLRDRYTGRVEGEAWLLVGDGLASASAILFITGSFGSGSTLVDTLLIALWAVLPRGLGRMIDPLLRKPRTWLQNLISAITFGATLIALVFIGLTLIEETASRGVSGYARPWLVLMIFIAWGIGFLLFMPRLYLLHDLFLSGLVALGLSIGRAGPTLAVTGFFLGLALSAAVRHQLLDVFVEIRRPHINIFNARRLALAFAALIALTFGASEWGSRTLFPSVGLVPPEPTATATWLPFSPGARTEPGGTEIAGIPPEEAGTEEGGGPPESASVDPRTIGGTPPGAGGGDGPSSQIGFTRRIALGGLSQPQADPRVAFVARVLDAFGKPEQRPSLRPNVLWRALTLAEFDPEAEAWLEEPLLIESIPWPDQLIPFEREKFPRGETQSIEFAVITPTTPTIVLPYFPAWLEPLENLPGGYHENRAGDLFPAAGLRQGTRYSGSIVRRPIGVNYGPRERTSGRHHVLSYSLLPPPDALGFDLERYVRPIFEGSSSIQGMVRRLRDHFEKSFQYDLDEYWIPVEGKLAEFLNQTRVGNCEYFATAAALLLRAGGASTRVVAGFVGYEWDPERLHYIVRNGRAHLWTEVYYPGHGWYPIDATTWVPIRRPEEVARALGETGAQAGSPNPESSNGSGSNGGGSSNAGGAGGNGSGENGGPDSDSEIANRQDAALAEIPDDPFAPREPGEPGEAPPPGEDPAFDWFAAVGSDGTPPPNEEEPFDSSEFDEQQEAFERMFEQKQRELERKKNFAQLALLLIGVGILAIVALQIFRPAPAALEEEEEEESVGPLGGIPDPRAGLSDLPPGWTPTDPGERILVSYHQLQESLAEVRRHRRAAETPREHGERQSQRYPEREPDFEALCRLVYAALYAPNPVTTEDADEADRLCSKLRSALR